MEMSLSQTNQAPPIRFEGTSKKKLKPAVVVGWKRAGALEVPLIGNVEQLSAGLAVHGIDLLALEPAVWDRGSGPYAPRVAPAPSAGIALLRIMMTTAISRPSEPSRTIRLWSAL
jgi:hypothetical protein